MFARMLDADCPPEKRDPDAIAGFVRREVVPVVEQEAGFCGVWFFLDSAGGRFCSLTLYAT